ncbi:hypothetical protein SAMN04487775_102131 [Treponema bryantii]|uniref:Uncharacterized protein n=1 Tax=Treponema bryantii TaxID=163 RepID=A0A1I3ITS3_9SPIR|nr:hypothetical protein [Treponema bryantii]SFI51365.1 hypothetical protein SAMN04487775_102131 [Treponema bryantii]
MTDKKDFFKKSVIISIILFITTALNAQSYNIDYYGIVSTEIDANMSKMTSDLYYTQLSEINNFSVSDRRSSPSLSERPDAANFSDGKLSFFTLITKDSKSDKWITTYYVVDKTKNEEHSKKKTYDSFYKILMEPKDVLKDTIKQLIENDSSTTAITASINDTGSIKGTSIASTEELSGTWGGEDNINKIVIMRGGRGFVIFNNGASMNITVELSGSADNKKVVITQKGNSNASFYPDLKRTAALSAAVSAKPIKWTLTLTDNNTLKGLKDTLLPDGDSYKEGSISVIWTRLN